MQKSNNLHEPARRIILILTPHVPTEVLQGIRSCDVVLLGQGIALDLPGMDLHHASLTDEQLRQVTKQFAQSIGAIRDDLTRRIISSFANDCFAYTVRPVLAVLSMLSEAIDKTGITSISIAVSYTHLTLPTTPYV